MKKLIACRNAIDHEEYEIKLVKDGLWVCPKCKHAYKALQCGNCRSRRPKDYKTQWSKPFVFGTDQ